MSVGIGLDTRLEVSFADRRRVAEEAARLGFASCWTNSVGMPDAFHLCVQAWEASATAVPGGLTTGIGVLGATQWTALTLAMQAATVGAVTGGHFVLGIGSGGYGAAHWTSLGLPNRPIAIMREYLTALRGLLAGETVTCEGSTVRLTRAHLDVEESVPVYLGALGPAMLRLAGAHADGAFLNWSTPEAVAQSTALVHDGATAAGRDPSAVRIAGFVRVSVDEDEDVARRALAAHMLPYALARPGIDTRLGYRGLFTRSGFDNVLTELEARRDAGASPQELAELAPPELLRAVGYFGRASGAADALSELSQGLDDCIARIVPARPSVESVLETVRAIRPSSS